MPFVCVSLLCLAAQSPVIAPTPALAVIDAYVRRIDTDQALTTRRHIHTYGHPNKPGADSLFWVYHTDFPGSSVAVYFAGRHLVKLVETARRAEDFTENSYYVRNDQLLFVKTRQAYCPLPTQFAAWRGRVSPCTDPADCYFRGQYYFAQGSCIRKRERGQSKWEPEYKIPGGGGRWVTVPELFPLQAARYATIFGNVPARRK